MNLKNIKPGDLIKIEVKGRAIKVKKGICLEITESSDKISIEIIDINGKLSRTLSTEDNLNIEEVSFGQDIDECLKELYTSVLKRRSIQKELDKEKANIEKITNKLLKSRDAVTRDTFFYSINKGVKDIGLDCNIIVGSHNKETLTVKGENFDIKIYTDKNFINHITVNSYRIMEHDMDSNMFNRVSYSAKSVSPINPSVNEISMKLSEFKPLHSESFLRYIKNNNYCLSRNENFYLDEDKNIVYNKGVYSIDSPDRILFSNKSLDLINFILNSILN